MVGTYGLLYGVLSLQIQKPRIWLSLSNALLLSTLSYKMTQIIHEDGFDSGRQLILAPQNTLLADYVIGFFTAEFVK